MAGGLYTKAIPASELTEKLAAVAAAVFGNQAVSLHVGCNAGFDLRTETVAATALKENAIVKQFVERYAGKDHVQSTNATINQPQNPASTITYSSADGIVATLSLSLNNDEARATRALAAIEEHFKVTSHVDLIRTRLSAPENAALQIRERGVAELEREVQRLATFLSDLTQRESEARRKAQEELEVSFREREAKLDEQYREKLALLDRRDQERVDDLVKRERAHDEKVKQFETREAKHVRRDLLTKIEAVLAGVKNFTVSAATTEKRDVVHRFTWLLMATSGTIVALMLYKVVAGAGWQFLPALAAASVTLVTTFVYYLKWNDRWFREHADSEFSAKRYQADILRASWVAELVSEWAKETDEEVSPELLSAFTRNLFRDVGGSRESEHPLEAMTGLMKRVNAITVGKGSISVRGLGDTPSKKRTPLAAKPAKTDVD
jgi:hypothetical protein